MAEEEATVEIEALESVYGEDCVVIQTHPLHIHLHILPRTAQLSSQQLVSEKKAKTSLKQNLLKQINSRMKLNKTPHSSRFDKTRLKMNLLTEKICYKGNSTSHQFVEAILEIRAGPQYPQEPPHIQIIDSKGLDEQRQSHLISGIQDKARDLSYCSMLVALCEEAVERLTSMNHPDGDCPLCLYPLLDEKSGDDVSPFMKLMSCFHCFHRECIIRWWNWIQNSKESESITSSGSSGRNRGVSLHQQVKERTGSCPVCRKVFHAKDIEHVFGMVGAFDQLNLNDAKADENILQSNSEKIRRQKFEAILKVQQENSGLFESKKPEAVRPAMFLPPTSSTRAISASEEKSKPQATGPKPCFSSNSSGFASRASTSDHRNTGMRKHGGSNSRKQVKAQWIKKETGNTN